jgi:CRP-like cAMP-binding protein
MAAALRASASELPSFPDAAAVAWLAALAARRPAVLIRHAEYDAFRSFLAECGMARDKPLGFYAGLTPAEEAELYAKVPSAFGVLDVPAGCMLSRAGDVRDESFLVLRGAVVVDGLETVGLGGMIGESAFLSGQKRACDIRCKATSGADLTSPDESSVLLLVVSRIGFQKAMKVAPEVAVKFLWNVAHELSVRFTARNELFKATALELKASKASADFEVSKLLKLVAKPPAARRGAERAGATFEEVSSKGSMALRRLRQHSRANLGLGISGGIRPGNKLAESAAVLPNKRSTETLETLNIRPGKKLGESADF